MKNNKPSWSYGKIFFIFLLAVGFAYFVSLLAVNNSKIFFGDVEHLMSDGIDRFSYEIDDIERRTKDLIEDVSCDFEYKDVKYSGLCGSVMEEKAFNLVILDKCINNPNNYRFKICKEMME